jgi:hypothetical protein
MSGLINQFYEHAVLPYPVAVATILVVSLLLAVGLGPLALPLATG